MDSLKTRKSMALSMTGLISTLVVAGLMLIVGTVVFSKVKDAMPDLGATAHANASEAVIESAADTTYDAFELATVALIVLAAAVIISILLGAFGSGSQ